ncbi:hypothetical protein [Janthinobacterium sp. RB2R34]|uniref:hypothetical protein n=1 Tax=Janthinobacterium sp. RB2R34 TaxID=3424193 RepID=UPI003F2202C0
MTPSETVTLSTEERQQPLPVARAPALHLDFSVSQNEEHVTLQLSTTHTRLALGERTHHYSLLALARQRLHDARRGLDASSQGWMETGQLALSLGLDPAHLNIHIFRARSQFRAVAGQTGELIERRRGELRFGELSFRIVRGSLLEGIFQSATTSAYGEE